MFLNCLRFLRSATLLSVTVVALTGCVRTVPPSVDTSVPPAAPLAASAPDAFPMSNDAVQLAPKDRISIIVVREPQLSLTEVRIDEDGTFDMPAVGRVTAAGRTTSQIAEEIRTNLGRNYLRNPIVSVNVVDFASNLVTVEGAVTQPGVYQFQPDTTLLGAVAMARGPVRAASLKQVAIFRTVKGVRSVATFDLAAVRAGTMVDPALMPGDRVLIGFNNLTQAWQDFLMSAPLIGIFTRL